MANAKKNDGRRDLSLIRKSGSTARVLNLALVFERFGDTDDFKDRPLFRSAKLNRTLIIKHVLRPSERSNFLIPEPHTTKIIFPYSPTELGIGGTALLVGEKRFEQMFRNAVGQSVSEEDFQADLELLNILHGLPSFDPFLLREQLRRAGREPARCYFDISDADIQRMIEFVSREIEPLANRAFAAAGRRGAQLAARLAEKLMTDESAQMLDPLRQTLRMSEPEYVEGVFAWKGFLYYKWLLGESAAAHATFTQRFAEFRILGNDRRARQDVEVARETVLNRLELAMRRASETLLEYSGAFAALLDNHPGAFRAFLLGAPAKFVPLGEATGAIKHMHSFWSFRFPPEEQPKLEAEEALDIMQEFDRMLSGLEILRDDVDQTLVL